MNTPLKYIVGDRVRLKGRRNYSRVNMARRKPDGQWEYMLGGMAVWVAEGDITHVIPKGTATAIPATSYPPKSDPQDQVSGVSGLRAALDASTVQQVELRKLMATMEHEHANRYELLSKEHNALTTECRELNDRACRLALKAQRLQAIVTAFIEGKI